VRLKVDWLTPAAQMPWPVSTPFRMRPNLEKLDSDSPALLLRDEQFDAYQRLRSAVFASRVERACVGDANSFVVNAIRGLTPSPLEGEGLGSGGSNAYANGSAASPLSRPSGTLSLEGRGESFVAAQTTALQLQEDFVILKHENETLRTEYLSVCFPSRWDPREKLGLDFSQIHAPVADNQMLLAAAPNIMTMAFMKQPMMRHVWLIVPSASLDQHPEQNDYSWSETLKDMSPLLPRLFFRVERQTTWPLPQLSRAVFFIRVMMSPLIDVLRLPPAGRPESVEGSPPRARALHDALASMTPAIVEYRGMTAAMPRLLDELSRL
jgi:dimethylamine monooxygenase subunit A